MREAWLSAFSDDARTVSVREAPEPTPGDGQIRVRMKLAPINPSDFNYINGTYFNALSPLVWNRGVAEPTFAPGGDRCPKPPYGLGVEGVGIVDAAGKGWLARRLVGKRVALAAGPPDGTWKQVALVDAKRAFPVPKSMSDDDASSFFVNPMTALVMVRRVLAVRRGATLMLTAAGSALGGMVRKLAELDGFVVINIVRSEAGAERLRQRGAQHVIATAQGDLVDAVHAVAPQGAGYALDCVGGRVGSQVLQCLKPNGHMLSYGSLSGEPLSFSPRDILMGRHKLEGFYLPDWLGGLSLPRRMRLVAQTASLIMDGTLGTPVAQTFALSDLSEALRVASSPGRAGKILLRLG